MQRKKCSYNISNFTEGNNLYAPQKTITESNEQPEKRLLTTGRHKVGDAMMRNEKQDQVVYDVVDIRDTHSNALVDHDGRDESVKQEYDSTKVFCLLHPAPNGESTNEKYVVCFQDYKSAVDNIKYLEIIHQTIISVYWRWKRIIEHEADRSGWQQTKN